MSFIDGSVHRAQGAALLEANDRIPPSAPRFTFHTPHPRTANTSRAPVRTLAATKDVWQRLTGRSGTPALRV